MTDFGRLDITYPDGRSVSLTLSGDSVTLGRAAGNDIRLDDAAIAPVHLRFSHRAGIIRLIALAEDPGVSLAGEPLPAHTERILGDTETIRIGGLRLAFNRRSDNTTVAMPSLSAATQPLSLGLRAEVDRDAIKVWPGASADIEVTVSNLADAAAEIQLETDGLPAGWAEPARLTFVLGAGEPSQIALRIKPTRRPDLPAGDYQLTILLSRLDPPGPALQLGVLVTLGAFGGLSLALEPALMPDRSRFAVALLNQGNEDLPLALSLWDPADELELQLERDSITLAPGERTQIAAEVAARARPRFGVARSLPFAIQVRARTASDYLVALPARVMVPARLSYRAAGLLIAVAMAVLLIALQFIAPPAPEIGTFALSPASVAQGTPVNLTFSGSNIGRYHIEVDHDPVADLPAETSSFTLETQGYLGTVEVALIAINGDRRARETRPLNVHRPLLLHRFQADKRFMYRHVRDMIAVSWDVSGASSLNISLPPGFETVSERGRGMPAGEIVLLGAPAQAIAIVLVAEDESGAMSEHRLEIGLRPPECTPRIDAPLHAGPDRRFPQRNIAIAGVPALAGGTVAGGEWIRVELASGASGWGLSSDFACDGFNPGALRLIHDLPPTPTDAPTITAAPRVTPTAPAEDSTSPTASVAAASVTTPTAAPDA